MPLSPTSPGANEAETVAAQVMEDLIDDVIKSDTNEPSVSFGHVLVSLVSYRFTLSCICSKNPFHWPVMAMVPLIST